MGSRRGRPGKFRTDRHRPFPEAGEVTRRGSALPRACAGRVNQERSWSARRRSSTRPSCRIRKGKKSPAFAGLFAWFCEMKCLSDRLASPGQQTKTHEAHAEQDDTARFRHANGPATIVTRVRE